MVKFCLQCKNAFWGGQFCPKCDGQVELLDMADEANRKYLPELNVDVRPKYYARSSMLLTCFGFIMALPLGAFLFIRGLEKTQSFPLSIAFGVGTVVLLAWGSWFLSQKLFDKQMEGVEAEDKEPQLD
ncbi:MAG: hypothetical protein KC553_07110 [Nitrospina sp.]|nr:hypothetical protein [Nitrospina sp.]